jgi:predicted DCC family thiol-disulfide oxidoreductase YuxK
LTSVRESRDVHATVSGRRQQHDESKTLCPSPAFQSQVAAPHPALGAVFERAARLLLPQGVRDRAYDTVSKWSGAFFGCDRSFLLPQTNKDTHMSVHLTQTNTSSCCPLFLSFVPHFPPQQVAENRYDILGKRDTCRLPDPGDDRFLA